MTEAVAVATITVSIAGVSYAAFSPREMTKRAEVVAEQAGCRAVEQAVLAYTTQHGTPPAKVTDVRPFVRGDVDAYRIAGGKVTGPGC